MSVKSMVANMSKVDVSSSSKRSCDINDYESANYYNYYRILERDNKNLDVGLIGFPTSTTTPTSTPIPPPSQSSIRPPGYLMPHLPITTPYPPISFIQLGKIFKLKEFTIDSEILDTCITSLWTQNYVNESTTPVEAKYSIPLHPSSVVSSFIIEFKDKILHGKIKEKERANEIYSDAIASGNQAFIASKTDNGLFSFSLGNIPPNESVTIRLTIQSEIGTHLESLHYCLHKFIFPQTITPDYKFNLSLKISLSSKIKNIKLNDGNAYTQNVKIEYLNQQRTKSLVTYSNNGQSTHSNGNGNIVTIIELEEDNKVSNKPHSCIEYNPVDKTYAVSLSFYPTFNQINQEDVYQKSEFIFVIDCSGSMSGEPIKKAKRAMEIIIRSLNEQCKFNIYCFGSTYTKAFPQSRMYNDESLAEITAYVDRISANLGGTELYEPIKNILSQEVDLEYPRQVFILTDGSIGNRDGLVNYVSKESGTTRIFTLGIGNAVDIELVVGLSKSCGGYYQLINNNSNMEVEVMKLLSIAFEPTLSNISFDWGVGYHDEANLKTSVIVAPAITRPVFNNERMMTYALIDYNGGEFTTPINVVMNCNGPLGNKLSYSITLDLTNKSSIDTESSNIHTLAAHKHIQDLEELERKSSAISKKDEIVKLGKKYNIVSKHTSFVVTCESDQVVEESMKSVDILNQREEVLHRAYPMPPGGAPIMFRNSSMVPGCPPPPPSASLSWSSSSSSSFGCPPPPPSSASASLSSFGCPPPPPPPGGAPPMQFTQYQQQSPPLSRQYAPSPIQNLSFKMASPPQKISQSISSSLPPNPTSNPNDKLISLLKLQSANGSWKISVSQQLKDMGVSFDNAMGNIPAEFAATPDIFITLLVIAKILKDFSSCKDQWEMSVNKSNKWIKSQITSLGFEISKFDSYLTLAKNYV